MKHLLTLATLAVPVAVSAAPRLGPDVYFQSHGARAYTVLIGPKEVANTEMMVSFNIRGKPGVTYTVELYVEVDNTGEKAKLLRSATLTVPAPKYEGRVLRGEFKLRTGQPGDTDEAKQPCLPYAISERFWSYQLVLKEGQTVVAASSAAFVPHTRRDVRVPE